MGIEGVCILERFRAGAVGVRGDVGGPVTCGCNISIGLDLVNSNETYGLCWDRDRDRGDGYSHS
jgi:hypothetical protein